MVSSGQPNSIGASHSASHALLRVNSGLLGSQGASMPQGTFSSLVSPRSQYNVNLLESSANVSSLLNHNFENDSSAASLSGLSRFQAGSVDTMAESNPMSVVANDVGFTSSLKHGNSVNSTSSGIAFNQQIEHPSGSTALLEQQQSQLLQFEPQKFQHGQQLMQHFSVSQNHMQQQQLHFQSVRGGLGALAPIKFEPQGMNDNIGLPQKLPALQSLAPVKLEPQQNPMNRSLGPIKLENQVSDQAAILHNQRQQQLLHMSRQSSQAAVAQMNYIQQQRILHMQQQQQQQQLLRALPHNQSQLHQQFQQQNLPIRSPLRQVYEPGTCARRLTQYMYQQQHRPNDNNIEFWRKFVAEFFAPSARKRWCVSLYGNTRQTIGVFPQDLWQCEICNRKPGRGFETTFEVLPRLFKIKYDSGTLEELLYVDMPREYQNANGQIILDYAKAIQESVFEHLRVVRDGQLRIVFSPDLKICSWEFCAKHHEELIPRRLIIPQVSQLGAAAQKYQASAQSSSASSQKTNLESNCNIFLASARQLAKALDIPLVNELGYSKRYIRCLQISEVVNSMKDLIDFSRQTGKGPMESLAHFPSKKRSLSEMNDPVEQPEKQQLVGQAHNNDHNSAHVGAVHPSMSNAVPSTDNSNGTVSIAIATSPGTGAGLMHQSSMNSQIDNQMTNLSSPYRTPVQIPSAGSSSNLPPSQPSTSSPFSSPTPSSSNNLNQGSHAAAATVNHVSSTNSSVQMSMRNPSQSNELDPNESQSSVEKIIQEIMITSQFAGADSMVGVDSRISNIKSINGVQQSSRNMLASGNSLVGTGNVIDNSGKVGGRNGLTDNAAGVMAGMENNLESLTGRIGRSMMHPGAGMSHQQELSNRLLNGIGANNLYDQYTWRSP